MYAVIELAGKQYRVTKGDTIVVSPLATYKPRLLMVVDGATVTTDRAKLDGGSVTTKVVGTVRDKAERRMRFKPKESRSSKRMLGHRQTYTKLEIEGIKL
jgi:large subunit ribosomal protein L21